MTTQENNEYTSAMGEAAQAYLDSFPYAHKLPAQFRWADLWAAMRNAAPMASAPVAGEAFKDECAATGQTCSYGPHGPHGQRQCKYCGAAPQASEARRQSWPRAGNLEIECDPTRFGPAPWHITDGVHHATGATPNEALDRFCHYLASAPAPRPVTAPRTHAECCEECERDTQGLSGDPKWCCYCGAKLRGLPSCTPVSDERVIDLDKLGWEAILEAAADSKWMPAEYRRNDWIADVCEWLRDDPPNAPAAGDALDAVRLDWLEQHDGRFYNMDRISSIVGVGFLVAGDLTGMRHQSVRAAIDAAIAQQKGEA